MARLTELDRLTWKLDTVEVINHAYIGSKYSKDGRNARQLMNYRRDLVRQVEKLLYKKTRTFWDTITRRRSRTI